MKIPKIHSISAASRSRALCEGLLRVASMLKYFRAHTPNIVDLPCYLPCIMWICAAASCCMQTYFSAGRWLSLFVLVLSSFSIQLVLVFIALAWLRARLKYMNHPP